MRKYFLHNEIACRCCGVAKTDAEFDERLIELREAWGKPLVVNSCCRCQKHNDSVGGKDASFHLFDRPMQTGLAFTIAIDIGWAAWTGVEKRKFVRMAFDRGWSVGIAKTFIHLDRRSDYPATKWKEPVLFTY